MTATGLGLGAGLGIGAGNPWGRGRGRGDGIEGELSVTKESNPHTCGTLKMVKKGSKSAYP